MRLSTATVTWLSIRRAECRDTRSRTDELFCVAWLLPGIYNNTSYLPCIWSRKLKLFFFLPDSRMPLTQAEVIVWHKLSEKLQGICFELKATRAKAEHIDKNFYQRLACLHFDIWLHHIASTCWQCNSGTESCHCASYFWLLHRRRNHTSGTCKVPSGSWCHWIPQGRCSFFQVVILCFYLICA